MGDATKDEVNRTPPTITEPKEVTDGFWSTKLQGLFTPWKVGAVAMVTGALGLVSNCLGWWSWGGEKATTSSVDDPQDWYAVALDYVQALPTEVWIGCSCIVAALGAGIWWFFRDPYSDAGMAEGTIYARTVRKFRKATGMSSGTVITLMVVLFLAVVALTGFLVWYFYYRKTDEKPNDEDPL